MKDGFETDRILSSVEVARILGKTRQQITCYCRQGKLDAFRVGRAWLIRFDSVSRFKEERKLCQKK